MEFVVSIVTYNSRNDIECLLADIKEYIIAPNVYIVFHDNGSSDGTLEYLESNKLSNMSIIKANNIGFGSGHNKIFKDYNADMYFLLNPDCRIYSRILDEIKFFDDIDIAAPNVYDFDGNIQNNFFSHHSAVKIIAYECFNFINSKCSFSLPVANQTNVDKRVSCDWISGCAMFVSKSVISKLGGFDPQIFLYAEDEDFCWRAKKNGFSVEKINIGKIVHFVGWNDNWKSKNLREIMYKSHKYVYRKINKGKKINTYLMLFANYFRYLLRSIN